MPDLSFAVQEPDAGWMAQRNVATECHSRVEGCSIAILQVAQKAKWRQRLIVGVCEGLLVWHYLHGFCAWAYASSAAVQQAGVSGSECCD